jgi:mono/diheme cytochrome c family protein
MRGDETRQLARWGLGAAGRLAVVGAIAAGLWGTLSGPAVRAYTPDQVAAGQQVYVANCVGCHGDRGQGAGPDDPEAPLLIGPRGLTGFRDALDVYQFTVDSMPSDKPGSLPPDDYWNVLAWLLAENGYSAPGAPLGPATAPGIPMRRQ